MCFHNKNKIKKTHIYKNVIERALIFSVQIKCFKNLETQTMNEINDENRG